MDSQTKAKRAQERIEKQRKELLETLYEDFETENPLRTGPIFPVSGCNDIDISSIIFCEDSIVEGLLRTMSALIEKAKTDIGCVDAKLAPIVILTETAYQKTPSAAMMMRFQYYVNDILQYVLSCTQSFRNILQQIRLIREMDVPTFPLNQQASFRKVWKVLGDLLTVFIKLDELVRSRPQLHNLFAILYESIVKSQEKNPGTNIDELSQIVINHTKEVELFLFSGECFRMIYQQSMGELDDCRNFSIEMMRAISDLFNRWEYAAARGARDRHQLTSIYALTVYYYHHFANFAEKSIVKLVFTAHKQVTFYHLIADVIFFPGDFLMKEISDNSLFDKKVSAEMRKQKNDFNEGKMAGIHLKCAWEASQRVPKWLEETEKFVKANKSSNWSAEKQKEAIKLTDLFLEGLNHAEVMNHNIKTYLRAISNSGLARSIKIDKNQLFMVFDVVEALKRMSFVFDTNFETIDEAITLAKQVWRLKMNVLIMEYPNVLDGKTEKEKTARKSAIDVASRMFLSSMVPARLTAACLALEFVDFETHVGKSRKDEYIELLWRFEVLSKAREIATRLTNCSFLSTCESLIELYFKLILERKPTTSDITYMFMACVDSANYWETSNMLERKSYTTKYHDMMKTVILDVIGTRVETDLRICSSPALKVAESDKLKKEDVKYIISLLQKFDNDSLTAAGFNFNDTVSRYLENVFYNLSIVAPFDRGLYAKMSFMGNEKYGLNMIDTEHLYIGVDNTYDVMATIRNLDQFVSTSNYSAFYKYFCKRQSYNKSLDCLTADHLGQAVKRLGAGLLPTTANVVYQTICSRLNTVIRILTSDQVRVHIERDIRNFHENAIKTNKKEFSFASTECFVKNFSQIVSENGTGFTSGSVVGTTTSVEDYLRNEMEMFRSAVSQIGNAFGFMSLIENSAETNGMKPGPDRSPCVQKLIENLSLIEATESNELDPSTSEVQKQEFIEKSARLRRLTNYLCDDNATTFVRFIAKEFEKSVKERKLAMNFYAVVPALSLAQVGKCMFYHNRKRRVASENLEYAELDDGFAIGIAFILTIFDEWKKYEEIDWMKSSSKHLETEKRNAEKSQLESQGNRLKLEKLEEMKYQFNQILTSINVVSHFFTKAEKDEISDKEDDTEAEEDAKDETKE